MREQPTILYTGAARKRVLVIAAAVLALAVSAAALFLFLPEKLRPYEPPPFETQAARGTPSPGENFGYSQISDRRGIFIVRIASVLYQQEDGSLKIFFTNPLENDVYLLCDIKTAKGDVLYKSGLLRPGEYLESVYPVTEIKNEAVNVEVNVYALNPEDFTSEGTISMDNILQPY
jgi:hypothetical protein